MTVRLFPIAACALLAACASTTPSPQPQSMSQYPAPLPSGSFTRAGVTATDTGSMQTFVAPPGTGMVRPASTDASTGSMAIPDSSMGNLRQGGTAGR